MRSLTMITIGEKPIALSVNGALVSVAARPIVSPQSGFVSDRRIADDIGGLGGDMAARSLRAGCRAAAVLRPRFCQLFPGSQP